jgi:hypothetical protein
MYEIFSLSIPETSGPDLFGVSDDQYYKRAVSSQELWLSATEVWVDMVIY